MKLALHKDRRRFLGLCFVNLPAIALAADSMTQAHSVVTHPMQFHWQHRNGRLHGQLTGPAGGWIAVGFNEQTQLKGTRYLIANVGTVTVDAEIHVAQVPHHTRVTNLDRSSDLKMVLANADTERSRLHFSVPHYNKNPFGIDLHPGSIVYLMLAYSTSTDFQHHSAWRQHQTVTL